jgi:hypothetical protein
VDSAELRRWREGGEPILDKRGLYALFLTAAILTVTTTPLTTVLSPTTRGPTTPQTRNHERPPPQTAWNKTYDVTGLGEFYSVEQTSDGGYIAAGDTNSSGAGLFDAWLVKTDSTGNLQWNTTYGGAAWDYALSVQQTSNGGFIMVGSTNDIINGQNKAWLVETDSAGNVQWNETYGDWLDTLYSVQQTSDGGYIAAGGAEILVHNVITPVKGWLVKTDSTGNLQWNKTYGGTKGDVLPSVRQTSDGGYIAAGYTLSFGPFRDPKHRVVNGWLVKTDSAGNLQWNKTYGGTQGGELFSIQLTFDGGYVAAGYTVPFGKADDFWLVKTDGNGNLQWSRAYGGTDYEDAKSVRQTSDGGYIVVGDRYWYWGAGVHIHAWLVKTDGRGYMQWNEVFGGTGEDNANSVQQTSDGGYILAGYTTFFDTGEFHSWLVKTQPDKVFSSGVVDPAVVVVTVVVFAAVIVAVVALAVRQTKPALHARRPREE